MFYLFNTATRQIAALNFASYWDAEGYRRTRKDASDYVVRSMDPTTAKVTKYVQGWAEPRALELTAAK